MNEVELDKGRQAVCVVCGAAVSDDNRPPITFSLGLCDHTTYVAGVILVCSEHYGDSADALHALFGRMSDMANQLVHGNVRYG